MLSLAHNASKVTAPLGVSGDGSLNAQVALDGTGFKKATLLLGRTIGNCSSEEVIGEVQEGTQALTWKPTRREADSLLVTKGSFAVSEFNEFAAGLGAQAPHEMLRGWSLMNDFALRRPGYIILVGTQRT